MKRFAGQVWDFYKDHELAQDVLETLAYSGVSAAGQALFSDMTAEEIGMSTAIGAGSAMVARPIGKSIGRAAGRQVNAVAPKLGDALAPLHPYTREGSAAVLKGLRQAGVDRNKRKVTKELLEAKRKHMAYDDEGNKLSNAETILGTFMKNRLDNIVQGGIALGTPVMMNIAGMDNQQTIDQLEM